MNRLRLALLAVGAVVGAGVLDGDRGALVVLQVLAVAGLLAALLATPVPCRLPRPAVPDGDGRDRFPSYDRVYAAVASSRQSARTVDLQLRPVLQRLVAAAVDERGPAAVRAAIGEEAWELVDPDRAARTDSRAGGLDTDALARVVSRLEAL